MKRLVRRYPKALQLVGQVSDEAAAGDKAAGKDCLSITYFYRVLLLASEKKNALLSMETAIVHTKDYTKGEKAALFSLCAFYPYAVALLDSLKTIYKKAFPASDLKFEESVLAHLPRKAPSLSLMSLFLSTTSLFSSHPSDGRDTSTARVKGRPQRLVSVVCKHLLPKQELLTLKRKNDRSSLPMTLADSRHWKRSVPSKLAGLDC